MKKEKEEIQKLKEEFERLTTIEEKFNFWEQKLDRKYIEKVSLFDDDYRFGNFEIVPQTDEEIEKLNRLCLEHEIESKKYSKNPPVLSQVLIDDYKKKFSEKRNNNRYKEDTINWIKNFIEEKQNPTLAIEKKRNDFFLEAYYDYLYDYAVPNFSKEVIESDIIYEINNGFEFAKFHDFVLTGKITNLIANSHNVQVLLLHYLEVGKGLHGRTKGFLYGNIINRDPETTRQLFSSIEKLKEDLENLKIIKKIFKGVNFTELVKEIDNDINRVQKKKK